MVLVPPAVPNMNCSYLTVDPLFSSFLVEEKTKNKNKKQNGALYVEQWQGEVVGKRMGRWTQERCMGQIFLFLSRCDKKDLLTGLASVYMACCHTFVTYGMWMLTVLSAVF